MAKKFDFLSPGIEIREIDQSFIPQEADAEGPIIIGRSRKGPANKPVKVRNLDDFVSVFGLPVAGGNGAQGDVWRDGNLTGPTYASYAAQAWLASEQSPVTFVRLAGEQHPQASTDGGRAGWKLAGSLTNDHTTNSTAYGLFLIDATSQGIARDSSGGAVADGLVSTGSLAAVFYANRGQIVLKGNKASDNSAVSEAGTFIKSGANKEFTITVKDENAVTTDLTFNLDRNSPDYIRSVLNTNPQLVNQTTVETAQRKSYWLGESFVRNIEDRGMSNAANGVLGILLPLEKADTGINWSYHKESAAESRTGWVFSQKTTSQTNLFRLKSLHVGEDIQKSYMIGIEDIKAPANPTVNSFGSFTICIKDMNGTTIEKYSNCNFNPSSENYVGKRIGDQYIEWDETNRRYRTYGDFQNQSNIVYIEIKDFIKNGGGQGYLPAGFRGPVRPKGFTLLKESLGANALGDNHEDFTAATATFKIDDSRKIATGHGAIISVGNTGAGNGLYITDKSRSGTNGNAFSIVFGTLNAAIKGANGTALSGITIEFVLKNEANIADAGTPGANQVFISNNKNSNSTDYDTLNDFAKAIAAVINGEQDNTELTVGGARSYAASVAFGSNVTGLLATPTNGGDPDSVFIASIANTSGIRLELRGSQTADSGTNAANFGAYGGVVFNNNTKVKLNSVSSNLVHTGGDQTVTTGNNTGATTVTLTNAAAATVTKTANVDFFVDGQDSDATALDNTLTNLNAALTAVSGFTAVADTGTDTITVTVDNTNAVGATGNTCKIGFTNGQSGTFTNQGTANDDDQQFTGGSSATDDFAGVFVKGNDVVPDTGGTTSLFVEGPTDFTASFLFPSLPLRANGTDGGAPDPYRVYWGLRTKISNQSNVNDPDFIDYLRRIPVASNSEMTTYEAGNVPTDYEYSFNFSLDDIVIDTTNNTTTYTSGAYDGTGGTDSYSKQNSFGDLLDKNVRQFLMPMYGGADGFDITEKEPLREDLISSTRNDVGDALHYTLNKAIDAVSDPEVVPANLLLIPGIKNPVITDKIIATAETRKDVLAIVDIEKDYKPVAERTTSDTESSALGSVTDAISTLKNRNLNSSYACTFYPAVQIVDSLNSGKLVWIPSSVAALGALGKSQAQSELWFAPAGFNRGGLGNLGGKRGPKVLQARQRLDSKERDLLYEVNVNPIATFPAEGVVVFGQKTLQADQSALDRINVRRLVLYLKSRVSDVARNLLFDQNVSSTWNRFKSQVNPILSETRSRFGLSDYKLVLDETTTTADLVDRNIMYAKIYIKPARAIEYIVVDFVITNTGADFV